MNIKENEVLSNYTTFKSGGRASYFVEVNSLDELTEAIKFALKKILKIFILGGGSNILVKDEGFNGLVIKINIKGINLIKNSDNNIIEVGSGEDWDFLVQYAVDNNLGGLENMSLIPGTVGGAIVGNIGAYGKEIKDVLSYVDLLDMRTARVIRYDHQRCDFSYRYSFFKTPIGKNFIILKAGFLVSEKSPINIDYPDLQKYFFSVNANGNGDGEDGENLKNTKDLVNYKDIRNAVIEIRKKKLPDYSIVGTAGSFFKNPILKEDHFLSLKNRYPDIQGHETENGIKVSLGWILDKICGLRGIKKGKVGTYEAQALVLINYGGTSKEIDELAKEIERIVFDKTGIKIEREVELVG